MALDRANSAYLLDPESPSVLEAYFAVLQSDGLWYGIAHALLRLIMLERPEWVQYEATKAAMWRELQVRKQNKIPPE